MQCVINKLGVMLLVLFMLMLGLCVIVMVFVVISYLEEDVVQLDFECWVGLCVFIIQCGLEEVVQVQLVVNYFYVIVGDFMCEQFESFIWLLLECYFYVCVFSVQCFVVDEDWLVFEVLCQGVKWGFEIIVFDGDCIVCVLQQLIYLVVDYVELVVGNEVVFGLDVLCNFVIMGVFDVVVVSGNFFLMLLIWLVQIGLDECGLLVIQLVYCGGVQLIDMVVCCVLLVGDIIVVLEFNGLVQKIFDGVGLMFDYEIGLCFYVGFQVDLVNLVYCYDSQFCVMQWMDQVIKLGSFFCYFFIIIISFDIVGQIWYMEISILLWLVFLDYYGLLFIGLVGVIVLLLGVVYMWVLLMCLYCVQ